MTFVLCKQEVVIRSLHRPTNARLVHVQLCLFDTLDFTVVHRVGICLNYTTVKGRKGGETKWVKVKHGKKKKNIKICACQHGQY